MNDIFARAGETGVSTNESAPRILVAGIGNIFLGDDAFGVEVARRLLRLDWPPNVRVVDFGIRGLDLTYALLEGYDLALLIDAAPRGHAPGTLSVIEPDPAGAAGPEPQPGQVAIDTHSMDPVKVLRLVQTMGGQIGRLLVVACEPAPCIPAEEGDEMSMGLSPRVEAAVAEAVSLVCSLVHQHLCGTGIAANAVG
jgi:hydrogenase maturation protease